MPLKTKYTAKSVDELLVKFEKAQARYEKVLNKKIKRDAAEKDLLRLAENSRDLFSEAVGGEKALLEEVFGGDCRRFHRFKNVLAAVEFSEAKNASDERWNGCQKWIGSVEQVLKDMGSFRPWVIASKPDKISFPTFTGDVLGFEDFMFEPVVEGTSADTLTWSISPALPLGLAMDERTGVISGRPMADVDVPEQVYTVTATNAAGSATTLLKFGVRAPPPASIAFPSNNIMVGDEIRWDPTVKGGKVQRWLIDKPLPAGLMLDTLTGSIVGFASAITEPSEYTITGENSSGAASTSFTFEITQAPPEEVRYPEVQNVDFPLGSKLYIIPDVTMKNAARNRATRPPQTTLGADLGAVLAGLPQGLPQKKSSDNLAQKESSDNAAQMRSSEHMRQRESSEDRLAPRPVGVRTSIRPMAKDAKQWGKQIATNGISSGAKRNKAQDNMWESMIKQGIQPQMQFTVEPPLPEGIYLSQTTGIITGSAQAECPRAVYKVTAQNDQGSASTVLNFGVKMNPPEALNYPDVDDVFYESQMYSIQPEVNGWVTKWEIEPALPKGLEFDETMGTISGVPEGRVDGGEWTVKAINDAGTAKFDLCFSVQRRKPGALSYQNVPADLQLLREVPPIYPIVTDNNDRPVEVDRWTVSPPLPAGLELNEKNGVISGTPTEVSDGTAYKITAANESGEVTHDVFFGVKVVPPYDLRYPTVDEVYAVGEVVVVKPKVQGGAESWSITPELPPGMTLSPETGLIKGVPLEITEERDYEITASNEAGGTSVLLTFGVSTPPPKSIAYPEMGTRLMCGREVVASPVVTPTSAGCTFEASPPLPAGIDFNPETGEITGSPIEPCAMTTYEVKAATKKGQTSCSIKFSCEKPPEDEYTIDEAFCSALEEITDLANMPPEPNPTKRIADWMVWMVHRAWLNDPTLTVFDFSNIYMSLPHIEPRIAPKLMKALSTNTHITSLLLSNSNLRNPQAHQLAEALKVNETLEVINIETNHLAPDGMKAIAEALTDRPNSRVNTLRMASMAGRGYSHGRPVEQAVAQMLLGNTTVTKLGFVASDVHWANEINRKLLMNQDIERRKRKQGDEEDDSHIRPQEKVLTRIFFEKVPDVAVWEVFDPDDAKLGLARRFMLARKLMPTREQLKNYAKSQGEPLKFAEVAPVVTAFRSKLMDVALGKEIRCHDNSQKSVDGILKQWSGKNDRFKLDVRTREERWQFDSGNKLPVMQVSDEFAQWLSME